MTEKNDRAERPARERAEAEPARAEPARAAEADEPKFTQDEAMSMARAHFDVAPEVIAGALHGMPKNRVRFTKAEIGEAVEAFLKREVN